MNDELRPILNPTPDASLLPIDVGFDLRVTRHPVTLPDKPKIVVRHMHWREEKAVITTGTHAYLRKVLRRSGYVVAD